MKQIFIYLSFLPLCLYRYTPTMVKTDNRQADRSLKVAHFSLELSKIDNFSKICQYDVMTNIINIIVS